MLNSPGLHLLTGHIGKGQQFDWVVAVGAEDGCIPDFRSADAPGIAEEARIFSVILSRARHGVVITHCREVEAADGRHWGKEPSRFLSKIPAIRLSQVSSWLGLVRWHEIR
ncbi:MAG: 3'-5' exonuclease [Micromonosporaceae bacterium]